MKPINIKECNEGISPITFGDIEEKNESPLETQLTA
jgi:hypothetical protein